MFNYMSSIRTRLGTAPQQHRIPRDATISLADKEINLNMAGNAAGALVRI